MELRRTVSIGVRDGLHARPAARLVRLAKSFASDVRLERDGHSADAKSALKLMLLGVREGDEIVLRTIGDDADRALDEVGAFLLGDTGEDDAAPQQPKPAAETVAAPTDPDHRLGVPISDGVAIGPAYLLEQRPLPEPTGRIGPEAVAAETAAFRAALARVTERLSADAGDGADQVVDALREVATDPEWTRLVEERIGEGNDAVAAVLLAGADIAGRIEALDDVYARARGEDVRAITRRLVGDLLGWEIHTLHEVPAGAVVVAEEITALDLSGAPLDRIGALLCRRGASTSHAAILARAHAIPAVFGCAEPIEGLAAAREVALDGATGEYRLDPSAAVIADFRARIAARREEEADLRRWVAIAPTTRDGHRVVVAANVGSLADVEPALAAGAEGVGLFRTEILFMERAELPDEDEQAAVYGALIDRFRPAVVTIRTLDVGGDKPIRAVPVPPEENPFLGWRGIRLGLDRPEVLRPQIRALLRAAVRGPLRVMVPMVSEPEEVRRVRRTIAECRDELAAAGVAHAAFELGIMVETPAAALLAPALAREVAFFSIGTNDLTQYVMAADRTNPMVARLCRPDHPAVLEAIRLVGSAAKAAGIPVAVCGEAAARLDLVETLIRLGVDELSMSPPAILRVKKRITEIRAEGPSDTGAH
jgi:phosphocarrier protein FPr